MGLAAAADTAWEADADSEVRISDDRVMGGVSRSRVEAATDGFVYTGTLSRDQGGGFVSMRIIDDRLDVRGAEGIELEVRGDGREYQLTAYRNDIRLRAGSYRTRFRPSSEWSTIRLPFAAFGAMQMGQDVAGVPSLDGDLSRIHQVGILLTDGPEGPFTLEVRSLRPYGAARERSGDPSDVIEHLGQAVAEGVPLYNRGDAGGCQRVYAAALQAIAERSELTDGEQALVRRALVEAEDRSPDRAAWRLRYGIDAVLAGLMTASVPSSAR